MYTCLYVYIYAKIIYVYMYLFVYTCIYLFIIYLFMYTPPFFGVYYIGAYLRRAGLCWGTNQDCLKYKFKPPKTTHQCHTREVQKTVYPAPPNRKSGFAQRARKPMHLSMVGTS